MYILFKTAGKNTEEFSFFGIAIVEFTVQFPGNKAE